MSECYCGGVAACLPCQERDAADARPMPLTDFLLARIAEDEALVPDSPEWDQQPQNDMRIEWSEVGAISEVLTIGEARLRAECEAKRRIVKRCQSELIGAGVAVGEMDNEAYTDALARDVLERLALPYADHPDYREEWKP